MRFLFLLLLTIATYAAEPARKWALRDGRTFEASLAAVDGLRATFVPAEKGAFVVPIAQLGAEDSDYIRAWREHWREPLVLPASLAPWPAQAVAPQGEVVLRGKEGGAFVYESANFRVASDIELPASAVNDLARVFEATRAALIAIPLGLHAGGERSKYDVSLHGDAEGYNDAGGPEGTGGYYDARSRKMLVLLPNIGIEKKKTGVRLDYGNSLFVLKHEVTHQLMALWHREMPIWASEGVAEVMASLPYVQGRYSLQNPNAGMRDYLLKWSNAKVSRSIKMIPPVRLMGMSRRDWNDAVKQEEAYDLYNSAALLTLYFINSEKGVPLAGYLDALRRGDDPADAERTHLLRGKSREALMPEIIAFARKLGVEVKP